MEDARANEKELWVMFQDMSKAFDSVNTDSLQAALKRIKIPEQFIKLMGNLLNDSHIAKSKLGYVMSEKWINNLQSKLRESLKLRVSVTAYVDDTNWFVPSRDKMEKILEVANEFYCMNDIAINKSKSHLIIINSNPLERTRGVGMGDTILHPVAEDFPIRSLGVGKPITDKQVIYIFNAVVIPMLEYSLNDMTLLETECLKITTRFISMIKNKALLAITTPNVVIHAKEVYNVENLWDRQVQIQSNNLLCKLNDKDVLGSSTQIRLQHLQNLFWSASAITEAPFLIKLKRRQSLLNDILIVCRKHDITFKLSRALKDNLLIKKILLHWHEISNNDRRKPKPGWFKVVETNVIYNATIREITPVLQERLGARYNILSLVESEKKALCPLDTKRWILSDGITSLPYGYWKIDAYKKMIASGLSNKEVEKKAMRVTLELKYQTL
ncbi:hypothetical protein Glove_526g9 [Diversispora epigaea]|uniref:Reverse transcriptase domain-containing protein n=1 Tax=Diversispora epigaea TaxID=1348612 RepID=A0A397GE16_9GLOM|nr:hypothetical protein Glove_526g9 [Diversispora epigaea]